MPKGWAGSEIETGRQRPEAADQASVLPGPALNLEVYMWDQVCVPLKDPAVKIWAGLAGFMSY